MLSAGLVGPGRYCRGGQRPFLRLLPPFRALASCIPGVCTAHKSVKRIGGQRHGSPDFVSAEHALALFLGLLTVFLCSSDILFLSVLFTNHSRYRFKLV